MENIFTKREDGTKITMSPYAPENPLEALYRQIVSDSLDYSITKRDAWRYAIVVGWPDNVLNDLAKEYGWSDGDVSRLKRMHLKYNECWRIIQDYGPVPKEHPSY